MPVNNCNCTFSLPASRTSPPSRTPSKAKPVTGLTGPQSVHTQRPNHFLCHTSALVKLSTGDSQQVSVAPRPMMPRCWTHPPPPSRKVDRPFVLRSASIPGLGCNHWPALHTDVQTRPAQIQSSRGSPSAQRGLLSNTASGPSGLRSSAEVTKNSGSTDPWKELQREMGSLKAESQRRWCRGGRRGVESLRNVLRAQGLAKTQTTKWTSTHKDSKEGMVAEAKAAANTLSSTLDRPVSSWRRDRGGNAGDGVPGNRL